jgi:hypothetical protein
MATKRLRNITLSATAPTPLAPPIQVDFRFEYTIDELPELVPGAKFEASVMVSVNVSGTMTFAQAYNNARTQAEAILAAQGLGGHTVAGG